MQNQRIRIRLKAFDYKLIDQSAMEIVDTAKRSAADEDRALQRPALAAREQDVARPVRNQDALAPDGHHRPDGQDGRPVDEARSSGGSGRRDQAAVTESPERLGNSSRGNFESRRSIAIGGVERKTK